MGSTIWSNVVILDSTQINLIIQVIIFQGTITMIVAQAKKTSYATIGTPNRCVSSSCHNKIFECLHQHACIHTISFLHQFCNIQNHHHLHSILFMQPFRVGFRTWIFHPSQQRCGGIPPSPPGLRNVGLRPPVLSLLGSSWRRVPSRAAAKRSACARGACLVVVVVFCSENSMASGRKKGYERTHY